jgi:hypothetical protein
MQQHTRLRGDRCRCPSCGELFNSTHAFDRHRAGSLPDGRRCLTAPEMVSRRMSINSAGFWVTETRANRARRGIGRERRSGDRTRPALWLWPAA